MRLQFARLLIGGLLLAQAIGPDGGTLTAAGLISVEGFDHMVVEVPTEVGIEYTITGAVPRGPFLDRVVGDGTPYVFVVDADQVPMLRIEAAGVGTVEPTLRPRSLRVILPDDAVPPAIEASYDLRFWAPRDLPVGAGRVPVPVTGERFFVRATEPSEASLPATTTLQVWVVRDEAGNLSIDRNDPDFAGRPPVEGAVVRWPATGQELITPANGVVTFGGALPGGRQELEIVAGEDTLRVPIFVVPGFSQFQSPFYGREAARAAALMAATDHFGSLDEVLGAMLPTPMPRLAPFFTWATAGGDQAPFNDPLRGFFSDPWMFVFTRHSGTMFGHPVLIVAVESSGGFTRTFEQFHTGFRVGPEIAFASLDDLLDPDFNLLVPVVEPGGFALPNLEPSGPEGDTTRVASGRAQGSAEADPRPAKVHLLSINGASESGLRYGVDRLVAALAPDTQIVLNVTDGVNLLAVPLVPEDEPPSVSALEAAIAQLGATVATGDLVVVYLVGHGSVDVDSGKPPGGVNLDGGIFNVNGNKPALTGFDILRYLKPLRPCRLWVLVESCYSGLILRSPAATTGYRPSVDLSMERAIEIGYLDPRTEFLAMSSTDYRTGANMRTNAVQNFFGYSYGGDFTNQLIALGWIGNPFRLQERFENFHGTVRSAGAGQSQNAQVLFRGALVACESPPPPQVPPLADDTEETAQDLPSAGEGRFSGEGVVYADPQDLIDVWRVSLPVGYYRATTDGDHQLTVKTPGGKVRSRTGPIPFRVPSEGTTFISVGPGKTFRYFVTVEREDGCFAGVRLRNQSSSTFGFRLYDSGGKLGSRLHLLAPGETLEVVTSGPLDDFDLHDFFTLGSDFPFNQNFQIQIGCGRLQTFTFNEFSTSFQQINLDL